MDLVNDSQKKAIHTTEGRVLILAGAGTGKTRVLTMRMAHLIKNLGVSPKSILGLTFTNKAAAEMRHRMGTMVAREAAKEVTLCTFHSFCMQILRAEIHHLGYTAQFSLYDEKDVERLVNMIVRDILGYDKELPSMASTMAAINQARSKGLKHDQLDGTRWHDEFSKEVYKRLIDSMRAYNAVDFDHLLFLTVELFEKFPTILDKYQEQYRYIMIDEYQDTNPVQYRLAYLLSSKYNNLCVVGDDDQSIYGWRGAEVKNILQFEHDTLIKLEQNYRSTNSILKAANAVIATNTQRHSKALWSDNGDGEPIEVFTAEDEIKEAEAVAARIAKWREKLALHWRDFAILYRSNALSRQFETALMKQPYQEAGEWRTGIPYQIFGGVEFYERREVKDLLAYLRVVLNPSDQEAILRIINQPRRGIGESTLDTLTAYNRTNKVPLWDVLKEADKHIQQGKALQGIRDFVEIIEAARERFKNPPLFETLNWMIEKINYQKAIIEEVKSDKMREFKWENVEEFVTALSEYEKQGRGSLKEFVSRLSLSHISHQMEGQTDMHADKVNMLTFHSSKGLEFPICFLIGMEDHIIPHEKSLKQTGIEEERRLMYVAITRARKHLCMSMTQKRLRMGQEMLCRPSRFMFEIPKDLLKAKHWHDI